MNPNDSLPSQGEDEDNADFLLDDAPLVCPRDQGGDKPCESCQ